MSASKNTPKLVHHGLNLASKLIDTDTEVSTIDLNLLENLNTNQSLNYIKLEENLNALEKNSKNLAVIDKEYRIYKEMIDDIDERSIKLTALVDELDAWSKEVEEKANERRKK